MRPPIEYRIPDHYRGDTYNGMRVTLISKITRNPINISNVSIAMQFRKNDITQELVKELELGNGIYVENAEEGIFVIDAFLIDLELGTYYYDIQFTFSNGTVKTYMKGSLKIVQDKTF